MSNLPHLPLIRAGQPYRSLTTVLLPDVRTGVPVVEVSQAHAGLVSRDLAALPGRRRELEALSTAELLAISGRAAELFAHGTLPLGDGAQSAEDYLAQLASTTGLPIALGRANLEKIRYVLAEMETVLGGLTRGLPLEILDRGHGRISTANGGRPVAFRRATDVLGAILPSNSPGVHALWLPAFALRIPLALKAGRQEPWTPYRVIQAFLAAGAPAAAFGFYPGDHSAATEVLLKAGRALLFGDAGTVAPWRGDPRIEIHGPGWSKVVIGPDRAPSWRDHLDLLVSSVAENGGRSCVNASGIWTTSHADELARGLAERLAAIDGHPLDDPQARLAAFPSRAAAERISQHLERQMAGAVDVSAQVRGPERVVEAGGCFFVRPTVVRCPADHPLARTELLFPFVSVVEVPRAELVTTLGASLVVTALTADADLRRELLAAGQIERLNLAPLPTCQVSWDQPHEGNLFELLYRQRAFAAPVEEAA